MTLIITKLHVKQSKIEGKKTLLQQEFTVYEWPKYQVQQNYSIKINNLGYSHSYGQYAYYTQLSIA